MQKNKTYRYTGPVMMFDNCVERNWTVNTWAPTKAKAMNNLIYRYKKDNNLSTKAKVTLPGKLVEVK